MGYSLSWAAVKGGKAEEIYSLLGLRPTGHREEFPESKIVAAGLPCGWHLVAFRRREMGDKTLARLSSLGDVVYCFVEDHVMFSAASAWTNGKCQWRVTHDSEKRGLLHLEAAGQLPASFTAIRDRQSAKQTADGGEKAEVDHIYEIPAELAKELTGFRHDQAPAGMSGDCFEVLERTHSVMPGFLRGLFRRNNR